MIHDAAAIILDEASMPYKTVYKMMNWILHNIKGIEKPIAAIPTVLYEKIQQILPVIKMIHVQTSMPVSKSPIYKSMW